MKTIPVIASLDALFALLNEPAKINAYVKELKAYRDEIKSMLVLVQTEDQARKIMHDAVNQRASAQEYDTNTRTSWTKEQAQGRAEIAASRAMLEADRETMAKETAQLKQDLHQFKSWQRSVEEDILAKQTSLGERTAAVVAREYALQAAEQLVAARAEKLRLALE